MLIIGSVITKGSVKQKQNRRFSAMVCAAILIANIVTAAISPIASAATVAGLDSPMLRVYIESAKKRAIAQAMRECINENRYIMKSARHADNGEWAVNNDTIPFVSPLVDPEDGKYGCNELVDPAVQLFGFANRTEMLCNLKPRGSSNTGGFPEEITCDNIGSFKGALKIPKENKDIVYKILAERDRFKLAEEDPAVDYALAYGSLLSTGNAGCQASIVTGPAPDIVESAVVNTDGTTSPAKLSIKKGGSKNMFPHLNRRFVGGAQSDTSPACNEIANWMKQLAPAAAAKMKTTAENLATEIQKSIRDALVKQCVDGGGDQQTCESNVDKWLASCKDRIPSSGTVSSGDLVNCLVEQSGKSPEEIRKALSTVPDISSEESAEGGQDKKTCNSEVPIIGWVICGIIQGLTTFADGMWGLFEWLLHSQPLNSDPGNTIFQTWGRLRDVANTLFAVIFLIVVFSQVTGIGISNYGIKKILPRLIIMVILANISFYLLQIGFDLANILGSTLDDVISKSSGKSINFGSAGMVQDVITAGVTFSAAGFGISAAIGAISLPGILIFLAIALVPAALAFLAGTVTLLIRMAVLPIIAVFAPVALVAYTLPNTKSLFDRWWKTFTSMLFLYPIAAVYYGALKFTAFILLNDNSTSNTLGRIMGSLLLLFGTGVISWLAIKSNTLAGKLAGAIRGGLSKITSPIQQGGREIAGNRLKEHLAGMRHGVGGGIVGSAIRSFDRRKRDRKQRIHLHEDIANREYLKGLAEDPSRLRGLANRPEGTALIAAAQQESHRKEVSNFEAEMWNMDLPELRQELTRAATNGETARAQAAQNKLLQSGSKGVEAFNNAIIDAEHNGPLESEMRSALAANIRSSHAGAMEKDYGTREWATGNDSMTASQFMAAKNAVEKGGLTAEKFANMTKEAQARMLETGSAATLTPDQRKMLVDTDGVYAGKLTRNVLDTLQQMQNTEIKIIHDNENQKGGKRLTYSEARQVAQQGTPNQPNTTNITNNNTQIFQTSNGQRVFSADSPAPSSNPQSNQTNGQKNSNQ